MKSTGRLIIFIFTFVALAASAYAQSPREQLQQMVDQLQKTPTDKVLREKVITLGAEIKPAPAIPEEANRAFVKGNVLFKEAKDASGFDLAISAYREALRIAPWWGDAYFNLAQALRYASKFEEAIASLKLYIASVQSGSAEALAAQNRIIELEAKGGVYTGSPREQLQKMVVQLQKTPNDNALRERIIKLGAEIKPAPAVPEEAERFEGRGQYAFKHAETEAEKLDAARQYLKAVDAAPWVAGYYFDLCTFLEAANRPAEAIRACKLYLTAAPEALDVADVRKRIAGLDYAVERMRGNVNRRQSCANISDIYESGAKVAQIGARKISLKLISSLYRGVWRNQLLLADITTLPPPATKRREFDPIDDTIQIEDRVKGMPYFRLTIARDGRITFGGYGSTQAEIVTSTSELYQLRTAQMNGCEIAAKGGKFFVYLAQGGGVRTNDGASVNGGLYFESDCKGNLPGEKPGWFPAVFIPHPETPGVTSDQASPAAQGFTLASANACRQVSTDGLGWLTP